MSLFKDYGRIFYRRTAEELYDPHLGIIVDYWYMAKRINTKSSIIDLLICTIIYDHIGNRFECKSMHQGDYKPWKEVIRQRIENHMLKTGVDKLMTKRISRDIEISNNKLVPYDRQEFLHKRKG